MNSLITNHIDSIVKIKAFDNAGKMIKLFTGSFYNTPPSFYRQSVLNNSFNNKIFIVTAKHCIMDSTIAKIELSFYYNQKLQTCTLNLSDYDYIEVPNCDLSVIHIKKQIFHNFSSRITKNMIYTTTVYSLLNCPVQVFGYYDPNIEPCILEFANIVSPYNIDKFFVKSKNIVEGYSGAPVFIEMLDSMRNNTLQLIGFVSKNVGNNNIEIVSAENLLLVDEQLKRK